MSSQLDEGGSDSSVGWTFIDRQAGEAHEGLAEETVEEWEPVFRAEGRPYEIIAPDKSRRLYDGD